MAPSPTITIDEPPPPSPTAEDVELAASALSHTQLKTFPPVSPPSTTIPPSSAITQWLSHPFSVTWRAALVKAPRLVPLSTLKITTPEGPFPFIYDFTSPRGSHIIPLYIWLPPRIPVSPNWPVLIDFHGGSFVLGSCLEQAPFCAQMCRELNAVVISVDYRMGPTARFPAANWDAEDVLAAVLDGESEAGTKLREAIAEKAGKRYKRMEKKDAKTARKLERKRPGNSRMSSFVRTKSALSLRPPLSRTNTGESVDSVSAASVQPAPSTLAPPSLGLPLSRTPTASSTLAVPPRSATASPAPSTTSISTTSSSTGALTPAPILDPTRISLSGFSSGGNLALNMVLSIHPPQVPVSWPSQFPPDYPDPIPILLYYPSFDSRLLASQRPRPANLPAGSPFWSEVDDILAPSYLPKNEAGHPRASPGLADVKTSLHPQVRAYLVLPELDNLAHQSETWTEKVKEAGREGDLEVRRVEGVTHGWTQFPVGWLKEVERVSREEVFERGSEFVKEGWVR